MKETKAPVGAIRGAISAVTKRAQEPYKKDRLDDHEPASNQPYIAPPRPDEDKTQRRPASAYMAGYNAYLAWVPFLSNPYKDKRQHGLYINGYKRAERDTWLRDLWYMKRRKRDS